MNLKNDPREVKRRYEKERYRKHRVKMLAQRKRYSKEHYETQWKSPEQLLAVTQWIQQFAL